MKICEDCIKQDVCKFKKEIDHWDKEGFFYGNKTVPKPLRVDITCELKRVEELPLYAVSPDTIGTTIDGVDWTYTSVN